MLAGGHAEDQKCLRDPENVAKPDTAQKSDSSVPFLGGEVLSFFFVGHALRQNGGNVALSCVLAQRGRLGNGSLRFFLVILKQRFSFFDGCWVFARPYGFLQGPMDAKIFS